MSLYSVLTKEQQILSSDETKEKDFELLGEANVRRQICRKTNGREGLVLPRFVI